MNHRITPNYPLPAKLSNLNVHPPEVVYRYRDLQMLMGEKLAHRVRRWAYLKPQLVQCLVTRGDFLARHLNKPTLTHCWLNVMCLLEYLSFVHVHDVA